MRKILTPFSIAASWLVWPALYVVISGSARTRVLLIHGGHILVIKNLLSDGRWSLPGGGIHSAETPAAGAARELAEETGIRLEPSQLKSLGSAPCTHHKITYTAHYFTATLDSRPQLTPDFEVLDLGWLAPSALTPANASPDVLAAIRKTLR